MNCYLSVSDLYFVNNFGICMFIQLTNIERILRDCVSRSYGCWVKRRSSRSCEKRCSFCGFFVAKAVFV